MKVLYDYQTFYIQQFGGVSNCFAHLIENLPAHITPEIAVRESDNIHLLRKRLVEELRPCGCTKNNFICQRKFPLKGDLFKVFSSIMPQKTSLGINKQYAIQQLEKGHYDVFHPTFYEMYFLKHLHGKPFVLTIHDMIPELYFKKSDMQISRKRELVKHAAHIVAVSENTKRDIVNMLQVPEEKITVVYHGAPEDVAYSETPIFDFRYLLYVGHRGTYKNFMPMVRALQPFMQRHEDLKLVCTEAPFTKEEQKLFQDLELSGRFVHIQASDEQVLTLYRHAQCFIFPSLYEGFGIPILEAYKAGCPVVLNRRSCFPEIAGDAAVYFEMDDSESNLDEQLERLLSDVGERKALLERQNHRLAQYSWKKAAAQLGNVYEKVKNHDVHYT